MSKNFSADSATRSLVLALSLVPALGGSTTAQAPTQAASAYYNTFSIDEVLKTGPKTIFVSPNYQVTLQIVGASITGISLELSKQKNFSVSRAQNGTMLFLDTLVKAGGADLNLILDDEMVLPLHLQVVNKPSGVRVYKGLSEDALVAENASAQAAPPSARPGQPATPASRPAAPVPPPTMLTAPAPRSRPGTTPAAKSPTVPAPKPLTVTPPRPVPAPVPKPAAVATQAAPAPRPVQSTAAAGSAPRAAVTTPAVTVLAVPSRPLTTTGAPRSAPTSRAVSPPASTLPSTRRAPTPVAAPRLDLTVQRDGADALLTYRLEAQPGTTVFADAKALRVTNGRAALPVETVQAPRSSLAPMTGVLRVKNAPRELTVTWNVRSTSAPYTFPFGRKVTVP